jgi:1-acyl-sn-glycerol-3-phosphate acyltransferase
MVKRTATFRRFGHFALKILVPLLCRVEVRGREYIPKRGPFLLVANHLSWVDPPLVVYLIPRDLGLTGLAAVAHRDDFLLGAIMEYWGVIWVRRGGSDREALRQSLDTLASGLPVGVAPEGTRSDTGALIEGKTGITYLALRASVPILPLSLAGTDQVVSRLKRLRRGRVQAAFSLPFLLPPRGGAPRREYMEYCTDLIMTRLASNLPQPYLGVYADHPLIEYWKFLDASGKADQPEWKRGLTLSA